MYFYGKSLLLDACLMFIPAKNIDIRINTFEKRSVFLFKLRVQTYWLPINSSIIEPNETYKII